MVGVVAGPELVSNDHNALGGIFLHCPGTLKVVFRNAVEELMVEDTLVSIDQVSLLFGINPAEVHIVSKFECSGATKSLKALISADFMKGSHLKGTDGNDLALSLNCVDKIGETVKLGNTLLAFSQLDSFGIDINITTERIVLRGRLPILIKKQAVKFSCKEDLDLLEESLAKFIHGLGKLSKGPVCGG